MRHPVFLVLAILLGLALNRLLPFTVSPDIPLSSFTPLIGPCLILLPSLASIEYVQRWPFMAGMRQLIGGADLVAPVKYYEPTAFGGSQIIVFERQGDVSGVLALDARAPGKAVASVLGAKEGELGAPGVLDARGKNGGKAKTVTATASKGPAHDLRQRKGAAVAAAEPTNANANANSSGVVEIRHFTVDGPVRKYGIGTELLVTALDAAFATPGTGRVIALTSAFTDGGEHIWTKMGFAPVEPEAGWRASAPLGLLKWTGRWVAVDKATWEVRRTQLFADHKTE